MSEQDQLSDEMKAILKKVEYTAAASSFNEVKSSYEANTGKKIDEVFKSVRETPVKVTPTSQVHLGRL